MEMQGLSKRALAFFAAQGKIGGKIGASKMTLEQRQERARKAGSAPKKPRDAKPR